METKKTAVLFVLLAVFLPHRAKRERVLLLGAFPHPVDFTDAAIRKSLLHVLPLKLQEEEYLNERSVALVCLAEAEALSEHAPKNPHGLFVAFQRLCALGSGPGSRGFRPRGDYLVVEVDDHPAGRRRPNGECRDNKPQKSGAFNELFDALLHRSLLQVGSRDANGR